MSSFVLFRSSETADKKLQILLPLTLHDRHPTSFALHTLLFDSNNEIKMFLAMLNLRGIGIKKAISILHKCGMRRLRMDAHHNDRQYMLKNLGVTGGLIYDMLAAQDHCPLAATLVQMGFDTERAMDLEEQYGDRSLEDALELAIVSP